MTEGYETTSTKEEKVFVELLAEELETFKNDFSEKMVDPANQPQGGPGGFPGGIPGGGPPAGIPGGPASSGSPFAPVE